MAHYVFPAATPAQPAAAYPVAQTAYVAAAPQAAYATAAPRAAAQAYADSYQTHAAAPQYAYTTRTQVAVTPTVTYDQKAYYQPAAAPAAAAAAAAYSAAESQYQAAAAKPVYSATASFATQQRLPQPKVTPVQVTTATATYVYSPATTPAVTTYAAAAATPAAAATSFVTTTASSYSSYDAALYTAATNYYQQQQTGKTTATWGFKKTNNTQTKPKPKMPPKPPQLHYCDVCKISCAGPQTYREHLEGQKHKKKEAAMKSGEEQKPPSGRAGQNQLRCELCDVTCTGADAYAAHIRGAKHQKVLKLHTKLGKPIPSTDPVVLSTPSTATPAKTTATTVKTTTVAPKPTPTPAATTVTKKVLSTPKITFVGGTQLKSTGQKLLEEAKAAAALKTEAAGISSMITQTTVETTNTETVKEEMDDQEEHLNILGEKDVTPVGHEYIEEVKNEMGKIISFQCKLCECKFNDPNAKEMHMKGRRHRLQYKKKVDPKLLVDVKPSLRARKIQEEKVRRQAQKEEYWRRQQEERWRDEMRMEEEFRRYHHDGGSGEFFDWQRMGGAKPGNFGMMGKKPDSSDDKHVMAKHAAIYPNETELQAVQSIVSSCEKALKLVSDYLSDLENKDDKSSRALKGVMRVGVLAKGLLLHGNLNVHLVVLCADKPTRTTLMRLADNLPKQLATVSEDKYTVRMCVEEAGLIVSNIKDPKTTCTITLTSPVMRDTSDGEIQTVTKDPPDVLDRQKCLRALAALRHAKWFQARANGLQSCVVVIRIMRDLCQRVPTWTPIGDWAMELLAEKCVSSGGVNMSPGDALRRVFECLASGILLPGGPGLHDPCEKEITDSTTNLTPQQREDITASAQHALRLIAFRQIHKVLGMDPLPPPKFVRKFNPRKRRHTGSGGDGQDGVAGEKTIKIAGGVDTS